MFKRIKFSGILILLLTSILLLGAFQKESVIPVRSATSSVYSFEESLVPISKGIKIEIEEVDPIAKFESNGFPVSIPEAVLYELIEKEYGSLELLQVQEIREIVKNFLFSRYRNLGVQERTDQYTLRSIIHINGSQYDYDQVCCQVGLPTTYVKAEITAYPAEGQDLWCYAEVIQNGVQQVFADDTMINASCPEGEDLYIKARARLFSDGSYDVDANITCRD